MTIITMGKLAGEINGRGFCDCSNGHPIENLLQSRFFNVVTINKICFIYSGAGVMGYLFCGTQQ